ncbi:helix-turn-helix domain-containing protein [Nocardia vinacea]|uniref:helix-turn-helix domain-containing protein n=1 Tax=Nocardia vinacea TaxID=96468 RepID=UPI0033FDAA9F
MSDLGVILHTAEEVAVALNLRSAHWLEESARKRQIPHTRIGKKLRFSRADIDEIVASRAVPAMGAGVQQIRSTQSTAHAAPGGRKSEGKRLRLKIPSTEA